MQRQTNYTLQEKREFALQMRRNPTPAEDHLWKHLRKNGWRFQRQAVVWGFIVDFWCPKLKLAIEVDGSVHEFEDQAERDDTKERALAELGIGLLRFLNDEIFASLPMVLANIQHECVYRERSLRLKAFGSSGVLNQEKNKTSSSSRRTGKVEIAPSACNRRLLDAGMLRSGTGHNFGKQWISQAKRLLRARDIQQGIAPQTTAEKIADQRLRLAEWMRQKGMTA